MVTPSRQPAADDVLAEIAVQCGFMTAEQVQLCREAVEQERTRGGKPTALAQVALGRRYMTVHQVEHVEELMMERGVHPMLGGLELLRKVGAGGMGTVYRARQVGLDRTVAVKVLRPELEADTEFIARFQREARLAAQVWHPKAVQVFDVGFDLGRHYMVMEYVDGAPLSERLRGQPVGEAWALRVIRDVAEPLSKAHSLGIIHRDIKPGNILLGRDGTARLSDLGLAKSTLGSDELTLTHTGHTAGTPYYMSPEQCRGDKEPDQRTDIYSLGVTLFLMVCGKLPFDGPTPFIVMHKQLVEPLPDPASVNPSLSAPVAALIRDMTAKEREKRIQTCREVLARIESIMVGLPPPTFHEVSTVVLDQEGAAGAALPGTSEPEAARAFRAARAPLRLWRRWPRGLRVAAVVAAVAIGSVAALLALQHGSPPGEPAPSAQGRGETGSAAGQGGPQGTSTPPAPPATGAKVAMVTPTVSQATAAPQAPDALRAPAGFKAMDGTTAEPYTHTGWAKDIVHEATGIEMVFIPSGEFMMGSPWSEAKRQDDEGPQHRVRIARPFYMGRYETTVGQWRSAGAPIERLATGGNRMPVRGPTWEDAHAFISRLNAQGPPGTFRMPTEAEWEYACRAGTSTPFSFGETVTPEQANFDQAFPYSGEPKDVTTVMQETGTHPPNPWGLYDMHGNAEEFCQDWYAPDYYAKSPVDDPPGPETGAGRVIRGGMYINRADQCRSASRASVAPDYSSGDVRVVVPLP